MLHQKLVPFAVAANQMPPQQDSKNCNYIYVTLQITYPLPYVDLIRPFRDGNKPTEHAPAKMKKWLLNRSPS
jgi:hypothetical protein